jgi:hypothetical protein
VSLVAQEALSNIGRHARATKVAVFLTTGGGRLDLMIRDNGAGFDLEKQRRGMGIANMFARAAEAGGTLDVDSKPGTGTKVVLSIPYRMTTTRDYKIAAWTFGSCTITAPSSIGRITRWCSSWSSSAGPLSFNPWPPIGRYGKRRRSEPDPDGIGGRSPRAARNYSTTFRSGSLR